MTNGKEREEKKNSIGRWSCKEKNKTQYKMSNN